MAVLFERQLFSVSDYYKMADTGILKPENKVELLNGEIVKMSPIKILHAAIVDLLDEEFKIALRKMVHCRNQNPIHIDNFSEPEPDLALVKKRKTRYRDRHPNADEVFLVVEVSDSTFLKDQTIKKKLYAKANIAEYWIINIPDRRVEVFKNPKEGDYSKTEVLAEGILRLEQFDFEIEVEEIF